MREFIYLGKSAVIKLDQLSTLAGYEWIVFKTDRRPSFGFDVIKVVRLDIQMILEIFSFDAFLPRTTAL